MGPGPGGFESPLVHLLGLVDDALLACIRGSGLGSSMVLTSWECQRTNPGKLASLPALGLVIFCSLPCSLLFYVLSSLIFVWLCKVSYFRGRNPGMWLFLASASTAYDLKSPDLQGCRLTCLPHMHGVLRRFRIDMSVMSIEIWEWEGFGGKSWGSILQEDCKQAVQPYARQRSSSSPEFVRRVEASASCLILSGQESVDAAHVCSSFSRVLLRCLSLDGCGCVASPFRRCLCVLARALSKIC